MEVVSKGGVNATRFYEQGITLGQILDDFHIQETRLCVVINGHYHEKLDEDFRVGPNDFVAIYPEFQGRTGVKIATTAILLAAAVATAGVGTPAFAGVGLGASLGTGGIIAAKIGILVGATLLVAGIQALAPQSLGQINGQERADSPTYSLTASGNSARPYQPLPLVLGTHNIYPDFGSRPYNEFKTYDVITYRSNSWHLLTPFTENEAFNATLFSIVRGGVTFNLKAPGIPAPAPNSDFWYRYVGNNNYYDTALIAETTPLPAINDKYRKTYVYVATASNPAFDGRWVEWEDLDQNGTGAFFSPPMLTFPNTQNFIYDTVDQDYTRKTEVVKQIMNYGFGDISYVSNQIGTTPATSYREYLEDDISTPGVNQTPTNWPLLQSEPIFTTTLVPSTILVGSFDHVNGNVDTVEGGRLDNVDGFLYPSNFVLREGLDDTFAIQVDIEGRQFGLDKVNGGTYMIQRNFNFEYSVAGSGSWFPFPNSMTLGAVSSVPYPLLHGSSGELWRDTIWVDNLALDQYEIRGQRIEPNEVSQDTVSEIYLKRVRFYQTDINQNYVAQNRKSIIVESDSQLNGTLGKLSSVVTTKIWVNDGSGNFTWTNVGNNNPADIFLYMARGGYYNATADGTLTYPYSPTIGWVNSADHPDNGEKLFGAGISDSRIDFTALTAWWNFCDAKGLVFDAVLDDPQNSGEVLKRIASVGRGSPTWSQGKIGVVFEDVNDVPVAMFGPDNMIRDSFEYSYLTEDLPDEVIVNYMNPANNWNQDSVRALAPGVINPKKTVTVDFWGITDTTQAQHEANLLVARQVYQRRLITFSTDAEGIMVTRGDVVYISHDVTSWDYESRIISTENDGTNITTFKVNTNIDDNILFVTIRYPDNTIITYPCTISNNVITLGAAWPLTQAPEILDDANTINPLTTFPNSIPEDFMAFLGERATPGKKVRVTSVVPQNDNLYRIECIDEEAGFYAQEFAVTGLPPAEQYERIKAEVTKADFILKGDGKAEIYWELNGATAITIQVSVNGSAYVLLTQGNGATIYGESITIEYAPGDLVNLVLNPVYTDAPFLAISANLSMVLT